MSIYTSQDNITFISDVRPGRVKVRYRTFTNALAFETEVEDVLSGLRLVDTLRTYDSHLEFHKKPATYCPSAELVQWGEDGEEVVVATVTLSPKAPWSRR
jgi:hypothetical protein